MIRRLSLSACLPLLSLLSAASAQAALPEAAAPRATVARLEALNASDSFKTAAARLDADWDRIVADIITLTEIPAPPFGEAKRASAFADMLKAHGLEDVEIDEEGNAMGLRRGTGKPGGPLLVVAAHLDTVFPAGTDVKVRREGDRLLAPGIGDDTCSLSVLLAFIRAMDAAGIRTTQDILFVGNVGEEGPGDLRGIRHLFSKGRYKDRVAQFVAFEPGRDGITIGGIGSRRYKVAFKGPGGHSNGDFGMVNPAYAMANAITRFSQMPVPKEPRTVFNVGIVEGGTSVNSIPFETAITVDMRSEGKAALDEQENYLLGLLQPAVDTENAARSTVKGKISYEAKKVGDRPVGLTPANSPIVQIATASALAAGTKPVYRIGSTDSNIPMSLGIPAITLGSGFSTSRSHSLEESLLLDRPGTVKHMTVGLATVIALAGGK
ncbi:M20/M25/M40 family metallo-hydrolase [Sphingobium sp. SYK-6]|uniref:M20/M25/M40 family metallo-hydrolase n=1 Tax=Sphingobium sp. (strain NBRC 103272 / SYK-6) TaxID=627192 RepID=UPI0003197976|nr:M20/M25/M40 family metallo-hydrolase [Sphingobium sp. SYK-6]